MEQIVYTSRAAAGVSGAGVFDIVATSARNNPGREVTGFLIFSDGEFLQLIEGPPNQLDRLLATLRTDLRHRDLEVLSRRPVAQRTFANWQMRRFDTDLGDPATILCKLREKGIAREALRTVEQFISRPRKAA